MIDLRSVAPSAIRFRFAPGAETGRWTLAASLRGTVRIFAGALAVLLVACAEADPPLPQLDIDAKRISVSGISSGAYMAQQVHLAFSATISGAAMIAGGPYGCAKGDLKTALAECLKPERPVDVAGLAQRVRDRAIAQSLDSISGLAGDRVYVLHGRADDTVAPAMSKASLDLYHALSDAADIQADLDRPMAHAFATATPGDCRPDDAHLANCGIDLAADIFRHVVDADLGEAGAPTGELLAFDQRPFADAEHDPLLADRGYLYVPKGGREQACGLHIAFHGCEMQAERIGTRFVAEAGYNRQADLAQVVVLYPQVRSSLMPLNPKACWDWWGYTGQEYDTREGAQMRWLRRVLTEFGIST